MSRPRTPSSRLACLVWSRLMFFLFFPFFPFLLSRRFDDDDVNCSDRQQLTALFTASINGWVLLERTSLVCGPSLDQESSLA
ncbi:hypothetical protein BD289DRAFT_434521 [Coniella lustricola]|uniref:Uncharacterized protein n=1 Tax=Coniella lustricola TaxID=2025994 RepID=A0A2T3A7F7_9PEZI|nr:hypothetical protein BD289DRAFT_434521 [Coniella lustricola]